MATALYRRYRPESFAEVIGQDHVTTPLRRALRAGRIGHAYLFSGPRGCGKTTSARILARCLNCAQGPTDEPCGQCDSCRDLSRGGAGSLDVVEIDAASHGGVDDARELRERASFAPVRDRFKVFIIDEAHMVTSAGFNALLKLVEEPPEHVKFVFATTEPDKVIGTIRSRTHHYPFRLIPPQVLGPYLDEVCTAESVNVGEGVLPLVVRAGGGSARDSLSVLDQLMAGAGEDGVDHATAIALLGFTDTALLDRAVTAVAQRDAAALYEAVEQVLATGHEPRRFVEDLLERMRDLIVLAAVPERGEDLLPQVPADELERMHAQASVFAPADLSRCGDLVHETLSTMSGATSPRLHLELLAARLVLRDEREAGTAASAPEPGSATAGAGTGARAMRQPGTAGAPASAAGAPAGGGRDEARRIAQESSAAARQARAAAAPPTAEPAHSRHAGPDPSRAQPAPSERPDAPQQQRPAPQQQRPAPTGWDDGPAPQDPPEEGAAGTPAGSGVDAAAVRDHWSAIVDELAQIRRPSWALISQNAHVHEVRGTTLLLGFRTEGLVSAFHRGTAAENLADAVRRIMRIDVTVDAVVGEDPGPGGASGGSGGGPGGAPGGSASGPDGAPGGSAGGPGGAGQGPDPAGRRGDPPSGGAGPQGSDTPRSSGVPASGPPRGGPPGSMGAERASRGGGAAGQTRPPRASDPVEDFPPEPEDPYPPDPRDHPDPGGRLPPRPEDRASPRADAAGENDRASAPPASAPSAGAATAVPDEVPVVEDEGRDDLPEGEPRTYGQNALRRAIAEGRVVRSQPAGRAAVSAGSEQGAPTPSAPDIASPAAVTPGPGPEASGPSSPVAREPDPSVPSSPISPVAASPAPAPVAATPSPAAPAVSPIASADEASAPSRPSEPAPGASASAAVSPMGSSSAAPAAAPSAPDPSASAAAPPTVSAASAPAPSGAALAREAAMASRNAGRRFGSGRGPATPDPEEDPTGGATRDDEDAVVVTRNGREVIETVLGGKVLEVIDESRDR